MNTNPSPPPPRRHATTIVGLAAAVVGLGIAGLSVFTHELMAQSESPVVTTTAQPPLLTPEELVQLLSPIALYPDALVAILLPASTVPSDIVLANRYLENNGNPDLAINQPWDDSVKSLSRYPDLVSWLDENLEWTSAVGEAFVEQPVDVMNTIQALRQQARAAGNLIDTPEQKVVVETNYIRILPADPEYIYIPQYDPQVVYVESYNPEPLLYFGIGFAVGSWLNYDFDWGRNCVYRGDWRGWDYDDNRGDRWLPNWANPWNNGDGGTSVNVVNINNNNANVWQPSQNARQQVNQRRRNNNGNARYIAKRDAAAIQQQNETVDRAVRYDPAKATNMPRPAKLERISKSDLPPRDRPGRADRDPSKTETAAPTAVLSPTPVDQQKGDRQKKERLTTLPPDATPKTEGKHKDRIDPTPTGEPKVTERNPVTAPTRPAPSIEDKPKKQKKDTSVSAPERPAQPGVIPPAQNPKVAEPTQPRKQVPQPSKPDREIQQTQPAQDPEPRKKDRPSAPQEIKEPKPNKPTQLQSPSTQAPQVPQPPQQPSAPKKEIRQEPSRPTVQPIEKRQVEQQTKQKQQERPAQPQPQKQQRPPQPQQQPQKQERPSQPQQQPQKQQRQEKQQTQQPQQKSKPEPKPQQPNAAPPAEQKPAAPASAEPTPESKSKKSK